MKRTIFRKKALERLSSPDNIHELVQVTSSRSWLALLALTGLVAAAIAWSVLGKLSKTTQGRGILIQSGGIAEITLLGSGIVHELLVEEGDYIEKEDTIAIVAQPELQLQIDNTKEKLNYLRDKRNKLVDYGMEEGVTKKLYQQKYKLEEKVTAAEKQKKNEEYNLNRVEKLWLKKEISAENVEKAKFRYVRAQRTHILFQDEMQKIQEQLIGINGGQSSELEELEVEIRELRGALDELQVKFTLSAYVRSPYEGKVIELMTKKGQLIELGVPVVSIEVANTTSSDLEAVIYLPPDEGKKVHKGMRARVAPSTVKIEEFGYIEGTVIQVSEYPSTRYGMARVLGSEDLVQTFLKTEAPIAVTVKLKKRKTQSGYHWTSSQGPPIEINAGTLCDANIVLAQQKPISLLFPGWK